MANLPNPLGSLDLNPFSTARWKLTLWYICIVMLVSFIFSGIIYRLLVQEIYTFETKQRLQQELWLKQRFNFSTPCTNVHFIPADEILLEAQKRIAIALLIMNGGILFLAGTGSYVLAGITLEPIRKMMEKQNEFVTNASHELRTPLAAMRLELEVAQRERGLSVRRAKDLLASTFDEVVRLQSLANNLLLLLQSATEEKRLTQSSVEISAVVQQSWRQLQSLAKSKKIQLVERNLEVSVVGVYDRFVDVFVILFDNAIKYSPEKSTITVEALAQKDQVCIRVQDQGFGIEAEDLPHIFERFYRADKARTREATGGYGLGLAIAHEIIERHKGTITAESVMGKGSTFIIFLPRAKK